MENKPIAGSHLTDTQVASAVRMLMRDQLDHEAVCLVARDRIVSLATERDQLKARLEAAERERDTATDDEAGHWIGIIRSLDPENLCDVFDGLGFEENLRQWLAARDAQQRREGAIEELLELANDRFTGGLFLPDRTHYTMAEVREILLEAAKRLREGGE